MWGLRLIFHPAVPKFIYVIFLSVFTEERRLFCAEVEGWGSHRMLPLTKLQEEEFLEDNKLIVEVYIKVVKVVNEGNLTGNEMVDYSGFHVLNRQVSQ